LQSVNEIILEHFSGNAPDLISIDVEGLDFEILSSIDFRKYRPTVICVETISFSDNFGGVKNKDIPEYLQQHGYFLYADTWINSIFVDKSRWRKEG
jgi:Methyltransferase FkbM domain